MRKTSNRFEVAAYILFFYLNFLNTANILGNDNVNVNVKQFTLNNTKEANPKCAAEKNRTVPETMTSANIYLC